MADEQDRGGPAEDDNETGGAWIFVSHSNKNLLLVRQVRDFLEKRGHNPILVYLKQKVGEDLLPELLRKEIEARKFFVLCNSPAARESSYVQMEVDYVKSRKDLNIYEEIDLEVPLSDQLEKLVVLSKRATVFLSCHAQDRAIAARVEKGLKDYDFKVLDQNDLPIGASTQDLLVAQIREAAEHGYVLLLISRAWTTSRWALAEMQQAFRLAVGKRNIIPLWIEEPSSHLDLPPAVRIVAGLDFRGDFDTAMARLFRVFRNTPME